MVEGLGGGEGGRKEVTEGDGGWMEGGMRLWGGERWILDRRGRRVEKKGGKGSRVK